MLSDEEENEEYRGDLSEEEFMRLADSVEYLLSYQFIQSMNLITLARFNKMLTEKTYLLGQEVFREGDESHSIYLVKSGSFEITKQMQVRNDFNDGMTCNFLRYRSAKKTYRVGKVLNEYVIPVYSLRYDTLQEFQDHQTSENTTLYPISLVG